MGTWFTIRRQNKSLFLNKNDTPEKHVISGIFLVMSWCRAGGGVQGVGNKKFRIYIYFFFTFFFVKNPRGRVLR